MNTNCQTIVFSNKAYNAIIDETFKKEPIETGGILLGHILDNGIWIVMEVLPPGTNSIHQYAYFEYDETFVNYLAKSVASKYQVELNLLGLWHRHPGSMDVFSGTDDQTNLIFANLNPKGAISGLVNVDPQFRLTMRHVLSPLRYEIVDFEVGDDLIPEEYFELKHFPEKGLHPTPSSSKKASETVIEKEFGIKSSNGNKEVKVIRRYSDKLKSALLYPICFLSLVLMLFSGMFKAGSKSDDGRFVSADSAIQNKEILDTVAFKKAVATYQTLLLENKQDSDTIALNNADLALSSSIKVYYDNLQEKPVVTKETKAKEKGNKASKKDKKSKVNVPVDKFKNWAFIFVLAIFLLSLIAVAYEYLLELWGAILNKWNSPWYVRHGDVILSEEYDLKRISQSCERSVENGIISFLLVTDKLYKETKDIIAFQIVYPQDFRKDKKLRIYLISPSFEEIIETNDKIDLKPLKKDLQSELYFEFNANSYREHYANEAVESFYRWLGITF